MLPVPARVGRPSPPATYLGVLRVPYAARLLMGTLIGRLPSGMAPLAIVLIGADIGGLQAAGGLAALYLVANAVGGPLLGRLVDRQGQIVVLTASACVAAVGFGTLTASSAASWASMAAVVLAGLAKPPLDAALRALWGPLMPDREHERVAVSLDSATQEIIYVVGPLLVAVLVYVSSAAAAVLMTAAVGLAGTLLVVTAPPSRRWAAEPRRANWLGPLQSPSLRTLFGAMVFVGVPMGALTPLAVHIADRLHSSGLSGGLPAAVSAGALAGGLVYGARTWPGSTLGHLVALCALFAVGWLPLMVTDKAPVAVATCLAPGLVMAPLLSAAYLLVARHAPAGTVTEANAFLVAALDIGCAVGTAVGGLFPTLALLPAGGTGAFLVLYTARGLRPPQLLRATAEPQQATT